DRIPNSNPAFEKRARLRARALVLVLLYSGFRISDAVQLRRAAIDSTGRLLIRVMKTRETLYIQLHPDVISALAALPVESPTYFFWSGNSQLISAINGAARTIRTVLEL